MENKQLLDDLIDDLTKRRKAGFVVIGDLSPDGQEITGLTGKFHLLSKPAKAAVLSKVDETFNLMARTFNG